MATLKIEGTADEIAKIADALRYGLDVRDGGGRFVSPEERRSRATPPARHLRAVVDPEPTLPGLTAGGDPR